MVYRTNDKPMEIYPQPHSGISVTCSKCGREGGTWNLYDPTKGILHRECFGCRYKWDELPIDAKSAKGPSGACYCAGNCFC